MKLKNILLEDLSFFKVTALIKTSTKINKIEIFNQIRALEGVVVLNVEQSDFLDEKKTEFYEYTLIYIKFITKQTPEKSINLMKSLATSGPTKIEGLLQINLRPQTLIKLNSY